MHPPPKALAEIKRISSLAQSLCRCPARDKRSSGTLLRLKAPFPSPSIIGLDWGELRETQQLAERSQSKPRQKKGWSFFISSAHNSDLPVSTRGRHGFTEPGTACRRWPKVRPRGTLIQLMPGTHLDKQWRTYKKVIQFKYFFFLCLCF